MICTHSTWISLCISFICSDESECDESESEDSESEDSESEESVVELEDDDIDPVLEEG